MKYYPNNTLTSFVTRLQTTIDLTGDWEVALSELHFPHSWYNVPREGMGFVIDGDAYTDYDDHQHFFIGVQLPGGYYDTLKDVINALNDSIAKRFGGGIIFGVTFPESEWPVFKYDEVSKRVGVDIPKQTWIQPTENLKLLLGMTTTNFRNTTDKVETRYGSDVGDVNGGVHALYVYCDLAESVPVGDIEAPLLRVVSAKGEKGEMQQRNFDQLMYIPLQKKHFDSVEIFIRDDLGNPIPFESGKLLVTLHFRRSKNPYFL